MQELIDELIGTEKAIREAYASGKRKRAYSLKEQAALTLDRIKQRIAHIGTQNEQ